MAVQDLPHMPHIDSAYYERIVSGKYLIKYPV